MCRQGIRAVAVVACAFALSSNADVVTEVEARLCGRYPEIVAPTDTTFFETNAIVGDRSVRVVESAGKSALRVAYPSSYAEPLVVETASQRIAIRPIGSRSATLRLSGDRLAYDGVYPGVDAIQIPRGHRSEELLFVRDRRSPLVFDYEIVEKRGVADIVLRGGAIRFTREPEEAGSRFEVIGGALEIERPWVIDATGTRSNNARWEILESGRRIRLTVDDHGLSYPLIIDPSFDAAGAVSPGRWFHTTTLLQNGKVLIAGGSDGVNRLNDTKLYDPANGTTTDGPDLSGNRDVHTATLLQNGKVLLCGADLGIHGVNTCDLYDPVANTMSATGPMNVARSAHTATLLPDGKVLIAGGLSGTLATNTAETYDPATGTFTPTANTMSAARHVHASVLLPNGKVLLSGGHDGSTGLLTADVYDPSTRTFTPSADTLATKRFHHSATLLPNGKVLLAFGHDGTSTIGTGELYDPGTDTFSNASNTGTPVWRHTATLLPNGTVLFTGGQLDNSTDTRTTTQIYGTDGAFSAGPAPLPAGRAVHTATMLPSGFVLIVGGYIGSTVYSDVLTYDPTQPAFAYSMTPAVDRSYPVASILPSGKVLVTGAPFEGSGSAAAELYDASADTFTATGSMNVPRQRHTLTLLPNGKVLVVGGYNSEGGLTSAELYDAATGTFTPTGNMEYVRARHAATLLANGKVLVSGGSQANGAKAELYDPNTGQFTPTANDMSDSRTDHDSTLLPNGKVLVVGDPNSSVHADLFDPATATFTATADDTQGNQYTRMTLLPGGNVFLNSTSSYQLYRPESDTFDASFLEAYIRDAGQAMTLLGTGRVLVSGGVVQGFAAPTTVLYDPVTDSARSSPSMQTGRVGHAAVALTDGRILMVGGFGDFARTTAELYDPGFGISNARRPVITSVPSTLCLPASLALTGTNFTGGSEGSQGSYNSSASNVPLLRLQRVDNRQLFWMRALSWNATSFTAASVSDLPVGHYRVSIVSNGIPSIEKIMEVTQGGASTLGSYSTTSITNGASGTASPSAPPVYRGTVTSRTLTVSPGFTGSVSINPVTGVVSFQNAGPVGSYTVTLTVSNTCGGTAQRSFQLNVVPITAPTGVSAVANNASRITITWAPVSGAASYEVFRSAGGGAGYAPVGSTATAGLVDESGLVPDKTYVYKVQAIDALGGGSPLSAPDLATTYFFTDDPPIIGLTTVKALHLTEARTGVNLVRAAAGLGAFSFTDSPAAGQPIKSTHIQQLRAALTAARDALGVPSITWTNSAAAGTLIRAADLTQIRTGCN